MLRSGRQTFPKLLFSGRRFFRSSPKFRCAKISSIGGPVSWWNSIMKGNAGVRLVVWALSFHKERIRHRNVTSRLSAAVEAEREVGYHHSTVSTWTSSSPPTGWLSQAETAKDRDRARRASERTDARACLTASRERFTVSPMPLVRRRPREEKILRARWSC